jgi:hypothetical protein
MADTAGDPLKTMVVDEVIREDGRYLLYYDWPDGTVADAGRSAGASDEPGPSSDDV